MITICKVEERNERLIRKLCAVWESSVRATHLFLSDREIEKIAMYIPSALREIPLLIIATNCENAPIAFMGIKGRKLEMLFVAATERRKGLGKQLLRYAIENYSVDELGVNEQNPDARMFYEHVGFRVYKRTASDEQGNPYPILYMRRGGVSESG